MKVIRDEMWGHGRVGDRAVVEDERLLSKNELDASVDLLIGRIKSTERSRLVEVPELLSLMYGWMEAGDREEVLKWVREQGKSDTGFLAFLSACRGWLQSDRIYHPLNRRDLAKFLDFDQMRERLGRISENADALDEERGLAKELLKAAELGDKR